MANTATEWVFETIKASPERRRPEFVREFVDKAIELKKLKESDLRRDFHQLAAESCGPGWADQLQAYAGRRSWAAEAGGTDAVGPDAFAALVGTALVRTIEQNFQRATSAVDGLFTDFPTPVSIEEIAHIFPAQITGGVMTVAPVMPYPMLFNPQGYSIIIPKPEKRGGIVQVSMEQQLNNRTAEVFDAAAAAGTTVGTDMTENKLKVLLGIVNNYTRNGTTYGTYQTATPWINRLDDFNIANGPAELDRLAQLFNNMIDPITGKEIIVNPNQIFIPSGSTFVTRKMLNAVELRTTPAGGVTEIISPNPMAGLPTPITDRMARRLLVANGLTALQADSYLIYGDISGAFAWRQVLPFQVLERNNEIADDLNFRHDIIFAVKARYFGVAFVKNPMLVTLGRKMA